MKSTQSNMNNSLAEKISNTLLKAQQEIEELVVQISLGKAEAEDKFEEIKKTFLDKTNEWKLMLSNVKNVGKERMDKLMAGLDQLQVQLFLGKAEAKEFFEEQQHKILSSINEFETELKTNPLLESLVLEFKDDIELLKLKMSILKLKYGLNGFPPEDKFKTKMNEARIKINHIFDKVENTVDNVKSKYSDFKDEIEQSYEHLKKAIHTL